MKSVPLLGCSALALAAAMLCVACPPPRDAPPVQTTAATFAAPKTSERAWSHYELAVTLHHGGQTDKSVSEYREAEAGFSDSQWAKSLAIYGRARALDDAGRCADASVAYGEYATFVQSFDPDGAAMARSYAPLCRTDKSQSVDPLTSDVATAVVARDYSRALAVAQIPGATGGAQRPWLDYNRGVALAELKRTDEAVQAFKLAEQGFKQDHDTWGRSVAIYGRARALDTGGRCPAATKVYEEYAAFVPDVGSAEEALEVARRCDAKP